MLLKVYEVTYVTYKIEISAKKTKLMTNNANGIQRQIKMKGKKLDIVTSFRYLDTVASDEGSKLVVLLRISQTTASLIIW